MSEPLTQGCPWLEGGRPGAEMTDSSLPGLTAPANRTGPQGPPKHGAQSSHSDLHYPRDGSVLTHQLVEQAGDGALEADRLPLPVVPRTLTVTPVVWF